MNKIVVPKNKLKQKSGSGGFRSDALDKAQQSIDNNDTDFAPIAEGCLNAIRHALANFGKSQDSDRLYHDLLDQLTQLRAQGSMFKYSSVTLLTDIVVDLLDSLKRVDSTIIQILDSYEQSTTLLLKKGVRNADDAAAQALANEIKSVCQKYKEKIAS